MYMTKEEIQEIVFNLNKKYFLNGLWKKREEFFAETDEEIKQSIFYKSAIYLLYIMSGELDKAKVVLDSFDLNDVPGLYLHLVYPCITGGEFFTINQKLIDCNFHMEAIVTLTAGRPYILNGFGDFSRLGVFLPRNRDKAKEILGNIYGKKNSNCLYELCLAEFYYQQNKCYDAELLVSHAIRTFDASNDMRLLFVALFQQLLLLIVNNQCPSISGYFKDMRSKLSRDGAQEFMYNMDALEAWYSSYEGNYEYIYNWFNTDAPDEYGDFNMLDLFRYTVKLHCYLIQENHIAIVALVEKLRPYLEKALRPKDLCSNDCILAMSLHSQGKLEEAFEVFERVLKLSKHHSYDRVIADEGDRMLQLMIDYKKIRGADDYLLYLIEITRKIAILYPYYLKTPYRNDEKFTEMEADILRLLEHGKNNEEIADYFMISVNTVKYHLKKIYAKLGVSSANHAVWHAKLLGIIK